MRWALALAALYLSCRSVLFNFDTMQMATALHHDEVYRLFNPYRVLSLAPYFAAFQVLRFDPLTLITTLNCLFSAAALGLFHRLLRREEDAAALIGTLGVAFSLGFWVHAAGGKWYGFSCLLLVAALWAIQSWLEEPTTRRALTAGLLAGLAALGHSTLISVALAGAILGRRRWGVYAGAVLAALTAGYAGMFALSASDPKGGGAAKLIPELLAEHRERQLFRSSAGTLLGRLPGMITGWRDPSGEVLGLPPRPLWPGLVAGAALAAVLARVPSRTLPRLLWTFLVLHLAVLAVADPLNENLLAALFPFWGLLACALPPRARPWALAAVVALGTWNLVTAVLPNHDPAQNPLYAETLEMRDLLQDGGILVHHPSLQGLYFTYFLGDRVLILDPATPSVEAQGRVRAALDPARLVLATPPVLEAEMLRSTTWTPYRERPGRPPVLRLTGL